MSRSERAVTFEATGDPRLPFAATVGSERWVVRLEEFPEAACVYTLLVNDTPAEALLEWPKAWTRPAPTADDPMERAEYEREIEHAARTSGIGPSKLVK
jgi:hypothetical protein